MRRIGPVLVVVALWTAPAVASWPSLCRMVSWFTGGPPESVSSLPLNGSKIPFAPGTAYSADILQDMIPAVHAFPAIPSKGVLRAESLKGAGTPTFRVTGHWTLGGLVAPHGAYGENTWENSAGAVVTPLRSLLKSGQVANLSAQDTFVVGDFQIPANGILVIPRGKEWSAPKGVRIETFDPKTTTLRQAVDRVIASEGLWSIQMEAGDGKLGATGTIAGHNINTPEFFRPLLDSNPRLSFGNHDISRVGNAQHFGDADITAMRLFSPYMAQVPPEQFALMKRIGAIPHSKSGEQKFLKAFLEYSLQEVDKLVQEAGMPETAKRRIEEKKAELKDWMNLVEVDLDLIAQQGLSISGAAPDIQKRLHDLRTQPAQLRKYVQDLVKKGLLDRVAPEPFASPMGVGETLSAFPPEKMRQVLQQANPSFGPNSSGLFELGYSMSRAIAVGEAQAQKEGLFPTIGQRFKELKGLPAADFDGVMKSLYLSAGTRSQTDVVVKIFSLPEVRDTIRLDFHETYEGNEASIRKLLSRMTVR